ncbi:MAG: ABC transporter ATP-binding protein [Alphaproteobacteria bacterium]|nr:ABC transporter ATP-binding protein [Alphaproteobacteria bacterium]
MPADDDSAPGTAARAVQGGPLPRTIAGYVWHRSGTHQILLSLLSAVVFGLSAIPLELQRRIVNDAIKSGATRTILWLAAGYAAVALAQNGVKLGLNVYRGWVSESAVRRLRQMIYALPGTAAARERPSLEETGVEVAMVLSEAEPIGGFVGISASEPLLQGGVLLSIIGYMTWLEPWVALLAAVFLLPQLVFVPPLQRMINRRAQARIGILRVVSADMITNNHGGESANRYLDEVFRLNMGIFKIKFTQNLLMNVTYHGAIAVALGAGGYLAAIGHIEVGSVVAIVAGLGRLNDPWGDLVNWWREMAVVSVKYRLFVQAADRLANPPPDAGAASPLAAGAS